MVPCNRRSSSEPGASARALSAKLLARDNLLLAILLFAKGQNWQNDLPRQHDHQLRRRRLKLQSAFQSRYIGGRPAGTQGLMVQ